MRISDWSSDVCSSDLALVHAAHEAVEVGAALAVAHAAAGLALGQRQAGVEQVDQEGLAAADAAPQVQAVGRLAAVAPEQPVQQAAARRLGEQVGRASCRESGL